MNTAAIVPGSATTQPAPRGVTRLEEALMLAARKGAWIERLAERAAGGARHAILVDATAPRAIAHLATPLFEMLRREGAIAPVGGNMRWQLSEKGRVAVRRLKSRTGDPAASDLQARSALPAEHSAPAVDPIDSPLAWLRRRTDKDGRPLLSEAQFEAGERLRGDFAFADLGPRVTMSWSPGSLPGSAARGAPDQGGLAERSMAARERVRRALAAVGPELGTILIDVCGRQKGLEEIELARGWAKRSAKVVLDLALNALARHYGYIAEPAQGPRGPARVRHWGADGFRPEIAVPDDAGPSPDAGGAEWQSD